MDLVNGFSRFSCEGFPRPRGDGPVQEYEFSVPDAVSPPTRGWTHREADDSPDVAGFPAHAGMDLLDSFGQVRPVRFPRPRGDGPVLPGSAGSRYRVSPPTRGWTCGHGTDRCFTIGFPAHAGMDPRTAPA